MRTVLEYITIIVIAILMTLILMNFDMNDSFRAVIALVTALIAGRLVNPNAYKNKDN